MRKIKTPTLDEYGLHPFGGYCKCYLAPWEKCSICKAMDAAQERWKSLDPEVLKKAEAEIHEAYLQIKDGGGR